VRESGERVRLVHELRELAGPEELLDGGHDRPDVDERLRRDLLHVLRRHALADHTLHAREADAELVLDQLADRTDAPVAEVVDVVHVVAGVALPQAHEVLDGREHVLAGERGLLDRQREAEFGVDLVAADLGKVVALGVEEQAVEQRPCGLDGGRLARAEALVDLDQRVLAGLGVVLLQRALDALGVPEDLEDLVAGLRDAEGLEQHRDRLLALPVDAHRHHVALVGLQLEPRAPGRDDLRRVDRLIGGLVALLRVVHARAPDELRHDDTLGAVDDEGAAVGHEREIAHEDLLLLELTGLTVHERHVDEERRLVGHVLFLALLNGVLGVAELVRTELNGKIAGEVLDR
jgi:hypothetical protein